MESDSTDRVLLTETVYKESVNTGIYASFIVGFFSFFGAWKIADKYGSIPLTIIVCVLGCGLIGLSVFLFKSQKKIFKISKNSKGKYAITLTSLNSKLLIDPVKKINFFYNDSPTRNAQIRGVSLYVVFYNQNGEAVFGLTASDVALIFYISKPGFKELKWNNGTSTDFLDGMDIYSGPVKEVYELTCNSESKFLF